jgi:hypothetical protein
MRGPERPSHIRRGPKGNLFLSHRPFTHAIGSPHCHVPLEGCPLPLREEEHVPKSHPRENHDQAQDNAEAPEACLSVRDEALEEFVCHFPIIIQQIITLVNSGESGETLTP